MSLKNSLVRLSWAAALALACGLPCAGCGDSGGQPVVKQSADQKAQQEAAEKATAEAFKSAKPGKTAAHR